MKLSEKVWSATQAVEVQVMGRVAHSRVQQSTEHDGMGETHLASIELEPLPGEVLGKLGLARQPREAISISVNQA